MPTRQPDGTGEHRLPVSVVDRAMAIIATFQCEYVRQSLSELSRRSGLPVATSYRIVQRLVAWGVLERDDDSKYRIGLRLWEIGSLAPRAMGLQRVARPYMQELYEATHANVQLAIREGHELLSIEHFRHPTLSRVWPRIGGRYALHTTAIGLVLLAHAPKDVRDEVLASKLRRFTEHTYVDPVELERVLADIRQRGYAISDRQVDLVHIGVAAPVCSPDRSVVAALSLVCVREEANTRSMIHAVRLTADGVSRALRTAWRSGPL
jgi:DNA-binding IclR family transcriptional regulator